MLSQLHGEIGLALYVHLPWCVRKCPYCDFNSHVVPAAGIPMQAYLDALYADLEFAVQGCAGRTVHAVFFGGGTPSLFPAQAVGQFLRRARELLSFAPDVEISLEANPGTIERGRFAEYLAAGVNRYSLGAQSFDDAALAALGRIHSADHIGAAVAELRAAGAENFNLDLMYALPQQTLAGALEDVERAIDLGPSHISHYQLTLEPDTPFAKHPPPLPEDEAAWDMQLACQERLAAAGYAQYEISAYALAGRKCEHNLNYWRFGDYLGVGAGAHGKLTELATGRITRTARVRHPAAYLAAREPAQRIAETREVRDEELPFEFALNVLRLTEGFSAAQFEICTRRSSVLIARTVEAALKRGLLTPRTGGGWVPTPLGHRFLNDLQTLFLPH